MKTLAKEGGKGERGTVTQFPSERDERVSVPVKVRKAERKIEVKRFTFYQ